MSGVIKDLRGVAMDSGGGVVDSAHCDGFWILIKLCRGVIDPFNGMRPLDSLTSLLSMRADTSEV